MLNALRLGNIMFFTGFASLQQSSGAVPVKFGPVHGDTVEMLGNANAWYGASDAVTEHKHFNYTSLNIDYFSAWMQRAKTLR